MKYKPDILHIQAIGPALFTPLARLLGMKVVLTSHGSNYRHLRWGKFARFVLKLGEYLGVIFASEVVSISQPIATHIKQKYNRDTTVIPNGVDAPVITKSQDVLKKYELNNEQYILAVGRLVPEKGFDVLIRAFNRARASSDHFKKENWRLTIVGEADYEDQYSLELKKKAKTGNHIIFTGLLAEKSLQQLYSHATLFVLPSYYEGLPIALLEAMSYGLPCIASDIPGNRSVGLRGERYFRAGDVDALCKKLVESVEYPMIEEEKNTQRSRVAREYDWQRIALSTVEIYNKAAAPHATR